MEQEGIEPSSEACSYKPFAPSIPNLPLKHAAYIQVDHSCTSLATRLQTSAALCLAGCRSDRHSQLHQPAKLSTASLARCVMLVTLVDGATATATEVHVADLLAPFYALA